MATISVNGVDVEAPSTANTDRWQSAFTPVLEALAEAISGDTITTGPQTFEGAKTFADGVAVEVDGYTRFFRPGFNVRDFSAAGSDTDVLQAALDACEASVIPASLLITGSLTLDDEITANCHLVFDYGASIDGGLLQLNGGYTAGPVQVFGTNCEVRIKAGSTDIIYPEHFGAVQLIEVKTDFTTDSTEALQRMFKSMQGQVYNAANDYTPGDYHSFRVHFIGMYGIIDEIRVNGGGAALIGTGPGLTGAGLKWIGGLVPENETRAMLRWYGCQFGLIDGLNFIGAPSVDVENRLFAGIALQSLGEAPSPFTAGIGRRMEVRRCQIGDTVGYYQQDVYYPAGGSAFQHGLMTHGDNGNGDFHVWDNVLVGRGDYAFAIWNDQNVNIQIRNCGANVTAKAGIWYRHGGEGNINGFYVGSVIDGAPWIMLGDVEGAGIGRDLKLTATSIGGEGNALGGSLIEATSGSSLVADFERCDCQLPGTDTPVFSAGLAFTCTMSAMQLTGTFVAGEGLHNMLSMVGSRNLTGVLVQSSTAYGSLEVCVDSCWAETFSATPIALQNEGRYLGGLNYTKTFTSKNAVSAISLADASLYAASSTNADELGLGNSGFGLESRLTNKSWLVYALDQIEQTVAGMLPANSLVLGVQCRAEGGNYCSHNSNNGSRFFVGGPADADFRKYGMGTGVGAPIFAAVTDGLTPFSTTAAKDVVLRCGWATPGETFTWAGDEISIPISANVFSAANIGDEIYFISGGLAGTKATIIDYIDPQTVQVDDTNTDSGEAAVFLPFAENARFLLAPLFITLNEVTAATNGSLLYAELAEVT